MQDTDASDAEDGNAQQGPHGRPLPGYLTERYRGWLVNRFEENRAWYARLAASGQHPRAMVIQCCDSRINVAEMFGAEPGDLFIVRNIANLVPPFGPDHNHHGTSAAVEFAVNALNVAHIVVVGHSMCGGVQACHDMCAGKAPELEESTSFIGRWMDILRPGYERVVARVQGEAAQKEELEREAVLVSLGEPGDLPLRRRGPARRGADAARRLVRHRHRPTACLAARERLRARVNGHAPAAPCRCVFGKGHFHWPQGLQPCPGQPMLARGSEPVNLERTAMTISRNVIRGLATAGAVALLANAAAAQDQKALDRALKARQGLMNLHVIEAGPLFAMAKGDMPYDAAKAGEHAKMLHALTGYDETRLFPAGSSNADMPGKTAALPAIWEKPDEFHQAFETLRTAIAKVDASAGEGQEALAAAVGQMGKACGDCHEKFREKN